MDPSKNIDDDCNGVLDQRLYYYQTKAGTVSSSPLSVRQLVRLFCPVREGLTPILAQNTQCLPVNPSAQRETSYGEWKAALDIDILREASCSSWFWTIGGKPAEGPGSCRKLLEVASDHGDIKSSKVMVFAQGITPAWATISDVKNVRMVLIALQSNQKNGSTAIEKSQTPSESIENAIDGKQPATDEEQDKIQSELEAFLSSSTGDQGINVGNASKEGEVDDQFYESDGGTRYVKDPLTGNWIHEALAPKEISEKADKKKESSQQIPAKNKVKSKKKKANFSKRNAKLWIYISGLPTQGVTVEDLQRYFSKAGLLDLDPETLQPKIKLYKDHSTGALKGDASICYARAESVELALQILDNSLWDKDHRLQIERAKFEAKASTKQGEGGVNRGDYGKRKRPVSQAQRKVARLALLQAQDEGFGGRLTGGRKGLCIIVVKRMMDGIPEEKLEEVLHESLQEFGSIEKITCISKTSVVIVKYAEPTAASAALQSLNGSPNPRTKQTMEAIYWDGVTDYTTVAGDEEKEKEEEEQRHEEFGNWLESQDELPPELQLQVAKD